MLMDYDELRYKFEAEWTSESQVIESATRHIFATHVAVPPLISVVLRA